MPWDVRRLNNNSFTKVDNVNEVSHPTAIGSIVILAKNGYFLSLSNDVLLDNCKEISRNVSYRTVSNYACVMVSSRIEVSEGNDFPIFVASCHGLEKHVHTKFRLSIRTYWLTMEIFSTVVLFSIDSSSWWEKKFLAGGIFFHEFEDVHRSDKVVLIVKQGLIYGFGNGFLSSKVDNGCDFPFVCFFNLENGFEQA